MKLSPDQIIAIALEARHVARSMPPHRMAAMVPALHEPGHAGVAVAAFEPAPTPTTGGT